MCVAMKLQCSLHVQMQQHITMLTLVRAVVHIIWIMSTVMDTRLACWVVLVTTLLVESTTMVLVFITVHLGMRLESSVMVCKTSMYTLLCVSMCACMV